jgi:cephalosporin-C deacetylase-like acetyl esterase
MLLSDPESYGLTPEETLAHTLEGEPPVGFDAFWTAWREEIDALPVHWTGRIEPGENRIEIPSLRAVRVVGRLTMPEETPRGVVVTTHGYAAPDDFPEGPEPWGARGLATIRLRVRGYPPSTIDVDDLRGDWILRNLGVADAWIVRGAVADIVQTVRCARTHFGPELPVLLHGESLGGGLAAIAAARMDPPPSRLVMALPSLGDWRWRADRYCAGAGGLVNEHLVAIRDERAEVMRSLLMYDAAHHAGAVTCPVLCKLAERDDVVPAPTAAAVYNALGSERRWRFVTRYGHFDGGVADMRRHAWFERIHPEFLDPAEDPGDVIARHIDRF